MRPDDLRLALGQKPFQPLRMHLTTGRIFNIKHPDMAIIGRSTVTLSLPDENGSGREAVVALVHIVWLEVAVKGANA